MNNEYIIVNKTAIQKKIEELKKEYSEKAEISDDQWCSIIAGQIISLSQIISQSTPLIPENIKLLQELIDEGYDPYDSAHHLQVQRMLKVIQEYLSNLKLDI